MRWMPILPLILFLTACTRDVVEYRQVLVNPPCETLTIVDVQPVDVTTTTTTFVNYL
ncbi:MAG: hypothetical protein Q8M03_16540 [Legionella sp.]|nr:hypothetical protein [Legionella sp.]